MRGAFGFMGNDGHGGERIRVSIVVRSAGKK